MKKDTIVSAKTVDEAVSAGAAELGTTAENVSYTVIEEPKKGFLGMGSSLAKVQVTYIYKPLEAARSFIETLMENLGITGEITVHDDGDGEALITISGDVFPTLAGDAASRCFGVRGMAAPRKENGIFQLLRNGIGSYARTNDQ